MGNKSYLLEFATLRNMKSISLLLFIGINLSFGQVTIDTIKVYNVNCCSETKVDGIIQTTHCWGGIYCEFYPTEQCESPSLKYSENNKNHELFMNSGKLFWIRLYSSGDQLLFEGLAFGDACVGPFKAYHLNGKIKVEGQYSSCKIKKNGKLKFTKSSGLRTGEWKFSNENGKLTKTENYP